MKALRNNRLWNILWILIVFLTGSCQKTDPGDCFTSTGADITESRSSQKFRMIVLNDNVNLVLTQGDHYAVSVHGGKNLLKKIETRIEDEKLTIENNNTCNWVRSFDREITVYATVDTLEHIQYRGSGDISSTNTLEGDSLQLSVWEGAGKVDLDVNMHRNYISFHIGTADIYYKGYCHLSYISATSFGPVHAENMFSTFTFIGNGGSNNCYIWTDYDLGASITSIGNIYYKGNPTIHLNRTGTGELIKLE